VQSEAALLRRARLLLALQSALAVATVLALVGAVAFLVVLRDQDRAAEGALRRAAERTDEDDLARPPPGISLFVLNQDGSVAQASPRPPVGLPDPRGLAARPGAPVRTRLSLPAGRFRTLTAVVGGGRVQAALSLAAQEAERARLLTASLLAGLLGMAGAAAVGGFVARRAMAPLGEALERQGRFVADASHELRTPLTLLSTRAQLLARDAAEARPAQISVEAAAVAADAARLDEVIEDLLLSARLDGGLDRQELVALDQVAAAAVQAAGAHASQRGIHLAADLHPAAVLGVPTALRRVLDALLDNALSLSPGGTEVAVRVGVDGGDAILEVADHGPGIDQAAAKRLFERFAHGAELPGQRPRFGIGLALVREVVAVHAGRIEVRGRDGRGAAFMVRLPLAHRSRRRLPRSI
jgi:two-component system, OmpR family, sensor kinase